MTNKGRGLFRLLRLFFVVGMIGGITFTPAPEVGRSKATGTAPPNILFILGDDLRWDMMGVYGNRDIRTPHLDRLGQEGAVFTQAYVASPFCAPSRPTFLSGLYPHQTGIYDDTGRLPSSVRTVAHYLQQAGYLNGFIGKLHLNNKPGELGFQAAPVWFPGLPDYLLRTGDDGTLGLISQIYINERGEVERLPASLQGGIERYIEEASRLATESFSNAAIHFITERSQENRPWFLWLATTAAHAPFYRDPNFTYKPSDIGPPPGWTEPEFPPVRDLSRLQRLLRFENDWIGYYSTTSHLDLQIGRVLAALDRTGQAENTVVIFTTDQGLMMGSHGFPGKRVWYEEDVRVPWLVRWPARIQGGTVLDSLTSSVDLLPTVMEIAGLSTEIPSDYEGLSLLPALGLRPGQGRERFFSEVTLKGAERQDQLSGDARLWQLVRQGPYKYVWFENGEELLFDLDADPGEFRNLGSTASAKQILQQMRALRQEWLQQTPPVPGAVRRESH